MSYVVLIKHLKNELIVEGPIFGSKKKAEKWAEEQMSIYEEEQAYKVVKMKKVKWK